MGRDQRGAGNKNTAGLQEVKIAIHEQVPPLSGDEWALVVAEAVKFLSKKRNWSAPEPDKITDFWWKRAGTLYKGVFESFKEVSKSGEKYPVCFSEWKTSLIPKEGLHLASWHPWTPMDQHLEHYGHYGQGISVLWITC